MLMIVDVEKPKPFDEIGPKRLEYALSHRTVTAIGRTMLGIRVFGQENIPKTGGAVIAANHRHFLDILVLPAAVPKRHVSMVARHELFNIPVIGRLFEDWGAMPIHRDEPTLDELRAIVEVARKDRLVGILPEGTRDKTRTKSHSQADLNEFKPGVAMIARRAKVPVVPAALYGMDRLLTHKRGGVFGEPMEYSPNSQHDTVWLRELMQRVEGLYTQLDEEFSAVSD